MPQAQQNQTMLLEIVEALQADLRRLQCTIDNTDTTLSGIPSKIGNQIVELNPYLNRIFTQQKETNSRLDKLIKGIEEQQKIDKERVSSEERLSSAVEELTSQMKINAEMMEKTILKSTQKTATQASDMQFQNAIPQTFVEAQPTKDGLSGISQRLAQKSPSSKVSKEEEIANDILNMLAYGKRYMHKNGAVEIRAQDRYKTKFLEAYYSYLNHKGRPLFNAESYTFDPTRDDFEMKLIQTYVQDREKHTKSKIVDEVMCRRAAIRG